VTSVERDRTLRLPPGPDGGNATGSASDGTVGTADVTTAAQSTPWGVARINSSAARTAAGGAAPQGDVDVAVLDTGIDYDHPDLDVTWGVDTVGSGVRYDPESYNDTDGHGTAAAGIVAALDDGQGTVGVAPDVDVYAVRVLPGDTGNTGDLVEGIDQAMKGPDGTVGTDDDTDVLSLSLGGSASDPAVDAALRNARAEGTIAITSAGNDGDGDPTTDEVSYPAKYDVAVAVAATRRDESTAVFSSEGPAVEVAAPGYLVYTTAPGDRYADFSGTSAAAPHVAGVAALVYAANPGATPNEVRRAINATARDIETPGVDNYSGNGRVQAERAVETAFDVGVEPGTATPATVENGTTVTQSVTFGVSAASADGSADTVRIVLPATATVTGVGSAVVDGPGSVVAGPTRNGRNVSVDVASSGGGRVDYTVNVSVDVVYDEGSTRDESIDAAVVDSTGERDRRTVATVTVTNASNPFPAGVPGVGAEPPTDLDGDGRYEDVDGNGVANFFDVIALLFAQPDIDAATLTAGEVAALDYDGNGVADFSDVIDLLFTVV
jgi:subtilisin family serine protease